MPAYEVIAESEKFGKNKHYRGAILDVEPGEVKHAELLCKLGKFKRYDGAVKKSVDLPDEAMSRAAKSEPLTEDEPLGERLVPRRRGRPPKYERRDMTATDGPTGEESGSQS